MTDSVNDDASERAGYVPWGRLSHLSSPVVPSSPVVTCRPVVLRRAEDALHVVLGFGNGMSSMNSSRSKPGRWRASEPPARPGIVGGSAGATSPNRLIRSKLRRADADVDLGLDEAESKTALIPSVAAYRRPVAGRICISPSHWSPT